LVTSGTALHLYRKVIEDTGDSLRAVREAMAAVAVYDFCCCHLPQLSPMTFTEDKGVAASTSGLCKK